MAKNNRVKKQTLSYRLSGDSEPITIKKSLPKNYEIIEGTLTEPPGTRWVRKKGEPLFQRDKTGKIIGKNPRYKNFLVVTDEDYFTTRIAEDRVYNPKEAADFTVDTALEAKISAKEKRLRKELQQRKEEDAKAVARAVARDKAKPAKAGATSTAKSKPQYQTVMTGSDGNKLPAVACRSKEEAESMKKNIEALGYKTEIQVVKTTTKQEMKSKAKAGVATKAKPAKVDKPNKAPTYTVGGKTFATLKEAKAYKAAQKQKASKPCEIKESNRKPSHKVVIFTARAKK